MKSWCVTCQLRTGRPTGISVSPFKDPCPHALTGERPHLVLMDPVLLPTFVPSRSVIIVDLL